MPRIATADFFEFQASVDRGTPGFQRFFQVCPWCHMEACEPSLQEPREPRRQTFLLSEIDYMERTSGRKRGKGGV